MAAASKSLATRLGPEKFAQYEAFVLKHFKLGEGRGKISRGLREKLHIEVAAGTVGYHLDQLRAGQQIKATVAKTAAEKLSIDLNEAQEKGVLESVDGKVRTVADALKKGGVDLNLWEVERSVVNSWEMGAKLPSGELVTTPLWQVKVWLKSKKGWSRDEFRALLIEDIKALKPKQPKIEAYKYGDADLLGELSIFDAHFGKLAWKPESGANYDLKIVRDRYNEAAESLLSRAKARKVGRILYVVGQDFFHTDQGNMTTNGTPQDTDGRWQKAFRVGCQCAIDTIQKALTFAPVDVVVVPGNHDRQKAFMLGDLLDARFHNVPEVTVQNEPSLYAYYRFGTNLIGFVHGDRVGSDKRRAMLPMTMTSDRPQDAAECLNHEWHLGHVHHEEEVVWVHRTSETIRDVSVRYLPSISSVDAWHRHENYRAPMAAELHYYDANEGRVGYEVYQIHE